MHIWFLAHDFTGLAQGGAQVAKSREIYIKALEALVSIASLQVRCFVLFFLFLTLDHFYDTRRSN